MNFVSTRSNTIQKTFSSAMCAGLAEDGGLFVPDYLPKIDLKSFTPDLTFLQFSQQLLHHFFTNDVLDTKLTQLTHHAFTFPLPLKQLNHNTFMLELFHGPTSSFKDFGARFLAECLNGISLIKKTTIMVATSGDTGSAVASAFYLKPNLNVIILFPKGQISERQQHQITCWDKNVIALAVDGTFDHCQQLVKTAFQDPWWQKHRPINSANSINIARLLPQVIYHAYTSMQFYYHHQQAPGFIVPTGNLGNAIGGYWAKKMGFPIREIVLATNANKTIPNYLRTGDYNPLPSILTLANAMDVGDPSNFERLNYLFNTFDAFKRNVKAISANDDAIRKTIERIYQRHKIIICPHTATAFFARQKLSKQPWIVVATADPGKFDTIIEPIIKTKIPLAPQLQAMLDRPVRIFEIGRRLEDIKKMLTLFNEDER